MGDSFKRICHQKALHDNIDALRTYLEPLNVALATGAAAKLIHMTRIPYEADENFICMKLDVMAAYPNVQRDAIVQALGDEDTLAHMQHFAYTTLKMKPKMILNGKPFEHHTRPQGVLTEEGVVQGDPLSGAYFCVALHPALVKLDAAVAAGGHGGSARASLSWAGP